MNKLIIYTLAGCDKCASLKKKLQDNRINYTEISCEDCSECCDSIEDLLNTTSYPIAKIDVAGVCYYGYVSSNNHQYSYLSVDELFDYIISKLG